ncbi:MAG: hypothetical protein QM296_13190 [Bacillota bacterium]|nr:hypothetical protein [Bacillota bacterium]
MSQQTTACGGFGRFGDDLPSSQCTQIIDCHTPTNILQYRNQNDGAEATSIEVNVGKRMLPIQASAFFSFLAMHGIGFSDGVSIASPELMFIQFSARLDLLVIIFSENCCSSHTDDLLSRTGISKKILACFCMAGRKHEWMQALQAL